VTEPETTETAPASTLSTTRLEAFSDGVIAIAATLLVLELHVPELGQDIWDVLGHQLPSLAAWVVSFLTILILWVNHHALFHAVERVDRVVLFLNGLLLLGISFVSYPTATLGRALESGEFERSAAVLYALTFVVTAGCFTALWSYLRAHPTLLTPAARAGADAALRRSLLGPGLYLVSLLVALVSAPAALVVAAAVAGYFALPPRHLRRRSPTSRRRGQRPR
jgi:uncharacterized membrane protein